MTTFLLLIVDDTVIIWWWCCVIGSTVALVDNIVTVTVIDNSVVDDVAVDDVVDDDVVDDVAVVVNVAVDDDVALFPLESTLQYEVTMMPTKLLAHSGPSILELRDHDLIVWKADTWDEMVRWQLNHLRSFKAKKHDLIIVSGK